MAHANRGRYAEGKIKDFLEDWKQVNAGFTYNRILDAHSARGAMSNPQPGDFQWFTKSGGAGWLDVSGRVFPNTRNGLIESKEVEHAFRLPYQNFGADQVGRMVIRQMAGSECIVLTCHRPAPREVFWRSVPLEFFRERPGAKYGSWDLSGFQAHDKLDTILTEYLS